ncbi:3-octaprenyl-4-hydroxybenzoate carboxy-lyase [Helicobacter enhydrae]|uniref:3-octaprenyl-4-hydroxybenzoate carboxy-lyase n=1 Tax=Helicobacter enhydrae TaxID=222136 RepID=A0A1B1U6V7_9HELI|nr:UbiX family flavin prenyltransferase [Helicobacter enhydrae]ANV98498.1 3-octaprenyl-4-hydroxybenzoate carboxy-lyase [Helicobacter enhydrae]
MKKLILGISGASGVRLGVRFLQEVKKHFECFVVVSHSACIVAQKEEGKDLMDVLFQENVKIYNEQEIDAGIASGSFGADVMAVIPTSMNMLAKISCGISDELISRCASVMLKERKTLLLAPREMPFSSIALENMSKLAGLGVIIAPPVLAYYAQSQDLQSMENFIIGKWLDVLGVPNSLYLRWSDR